MVSLSPTIAIIIPIFIAVYCMCFRRVLLFLFPPILIIIIISCSSASDRIHSENLLMPLRRTRK